MVSTRPPGTYSPSARTGRRGGGSGGVAGTVRRAGSDALPTVPVDSWATSRPDTAFRFRGCFDMGNPLQYNPGLADPDGPGAPTDPGFSIRSATGRTACACEPQLHVSAHAHQTCTSFRGFSHPYPPGELTSAASPANWSPGLPKRPALKRGRPAPRAPRRRACSGAPDKSTRSSTAAARRLLLGSRAVRLCLAAAARARRGPLPRERESARSLGWLRRPGADGAPPRYAAGGRPCCTPAGCGPRMWSSLHSAWSPRRGRRVCRGLPSGCRPRRRLVDALIFLITPDRELDPAHQRRRGSGPPRPATRGSNDRW